MKLTRMGWIAGLAMVSLLLGSVPLAAAPQQLSFNQIYITDVRDVSFVVSWTTDTASDGGVEWGTTETPDGSWSTTWDVVGSSTTHYVMITGLTAGETYYFQVHSGGETDNNGGAYYSVTTGPTLGLPGTDRSIRGYVYAPGSTTPVPNAVVYMQLQGSGGNSQWVSARADDTYGFWTYVLDNVRVSSYDAYYTIQDGVDSLIMRTQGGEVGYVGNTFTVPAAGSYPAMFNTTLEDTPNAVTLSKLTSQNGAFTGAGVLIGLCAVMGLVVLSPRKK